MQGLAEKHSTGWRNEPRPFKSPSGWSRKGLWLGGVASGIAVDASSINEVAAASAVDESAPKESSAPISKYVTLRNAFTAVDNGPSVWHSLWRLALFLRHGRHVVVYGQNYSLSSLSLSFCAL